MIYTIKDLSEGKCAVKNDGTLEELREVLKLAFPKDSFILSGGGTYYYPHEYNPGRWVGNNFTNLPKQSVKQFLVTSSEYKGELKGFPKEVVERMLDCQVEQGNERDITVFEEDRLAGYTEGRGGMKWTKTTENLNFWDNVIVKRNFNLFFDKYPKEIKPKYKGKVVHCETQEQWNFACKKLGRKDTVPWSKTKNTINLANPDSSSTKNVWFKKEFQVLSFQEWLDENGYVFGDKPKFIEGTWYESNCGKWYIKLKNVELKTRGNKLWVSAFIYNNRYQISSDDFFWEHEISKAKLAPMEEVNKYLPKKEHSWKDYKEGDYVVVTEFEGETDWNHWFMPGEVLKLGGDDWEDSLVNSFGACSKVYPEGSGMSRSFEENYKIRKATQEEIDNSQRETSIHLKYGYIAKLQREKKEMLDYIERERSIQIVDFSKLKVKLRKKRIKISL